MKKGAFIFVTLIILVLLIGIAIPKLTVHDLVPVDPSLKKCGMYGVRMSLNNSFERIALMLGKSRVTQVNANDVGVESFTLFRIPFGMLRGQREMKIGVTCDFPAPNNASIVRPAMAVGPIVHIDQSDYGQWISTIDRQPILQWQEDGTAPKVYAIREITKGQFAGKVLAMQTVENGYYYQVFFIAQPDGKRVASFFDYPDAGGLAMIPTDELPSELLWSNILTTDDGRIKFGHGPKIILPDATISMGSAVPGVTIDGMHVIAQPITLSESDGRDLTSFKKNTYHLQLPFGGLIYLRPILYGIQKDDGTVAVKWTAGDPKVSDYQDPQYAYPVWHCFAGQALDRIERSLIETGKTESGDPVYEIDPVRYESVYQCLYKLTKPRYCSCANGNTNCGVKEDPYPQSFSTFLVTHPFFLVRNELGDLLPYQRSDVRQSDGKGCGDDG